MGSVLGGPLAAMMHEATGSWTPVFMTVIGMDFLTAFLALIILKPMRRKFLANTPQEMEMNSAAAPATVLK